MVVWQNEPVATILGGKILVNKTATTNIYHHYVCCNLSILSYHGCCDVTERYSGWS